MVGHGEAPSVEQTERFIGIVDKFFEVFGKNFLIIPIHFRNIQMILLLFTAHMDL